MASYSKDEVLESVRIAMDANATDELLLSDVDSDTLRLDELICQKVAEAAMAIESMCPVELLELSDAKRIPSSCCERPNWFGPVAGVGGGFIMLPKDFMRLVVFKMSDWSYSVNEAIGINDPRYKMQKSRFAGLAGTPQRPVVAIVPKHHVPKRPTPEHDVPEHEGTGVTRIEPKSLGGLCLEFYSCRDGAKKDEDNRPIEVTIEEALYLPRPFWSAGNICLPTLLYHDIINKAAASVVAVINQQ